jgi:hypothetical protein
VLQHVNATRYITPLREGGSLPGLMEADDLGTYVVKFRAAGQGTRALVAEVVSAGLARVLGLPVPELVTVELAAGFAAGEPDEEIQHLLRESVGVNLGIDFLPGSLDYDPKAFPLDPIITGRIAWFDALIGNVDRSYRNPNLLWWNGIRLIDHGATLTFAHRWSSAEDADVRPYLLTDHVLVHSSPDVRAADADLSPLLIDAVVDEVVADIPEVWIDTEAQFATTNAVRAAYAARIRGRLAARAAWMPGLIESAALAGADRLPPKRNRPDWVPDLSRGTSDE